QTILERDQILQDANKIAEELIKEKLVKAQELITYLQSLQQKSIKPHELIEAKYQLKQIKEENLLTKTTAQDEDFFENEQVFIPKYQTYGIILKENKNNTFDVQIGNATVKLNKQDLQKTSKEVKNKPTSSSITKISSNITRNVGLKLDLRGKRYEEAKILLEKYLDDCLVSGLNEVIIIHGYGTGTIRNLVQDFLRNNPHVESFRYGDGSEGGFGATVVKIKK
ncbi:MAG TPA: Smr/MutS family protein, partial [Bacilli bacterium]|nr:Smr/MutS family protein [Bacilli bacterium]